MTSTSTTSTTTVEARQEVVRDVVGREILMGGEADLVEVLHRLLARARLLLRYQQNLALAIEEALGWFQTPPAAVPFNAATMETQIWRTVSQAASSESDAELMGQGAANASAPVVLLQPGFPSSVAQLTEALPGMPLSTIAGLRRRAWRVNADNVVGAANPGEQSGTTEVADCDLYLLQTDPSTLVPLPTNCGALPRQSGTAGDLKAPLAERTRTGEGEEIADKHPCLA
ncbi:adkA [Symbiodinium sp. KB8]|nr:adkA [Symbiodinium sp. KB8]